MKIEKITNEHEYQLALKAIEAVMDAKENTPEGVELLRLGALIEEYEDIHYSLNTPKQSDKES